MNRTRIVGVILLVIGLGMVFIASKALQKSETTASATTTPGNPPSAIIQAKAESTIQRAKNLKSGLEQERKDAEKFGLSILFERERKAYRQIRHRFILNPKLAEACRKTDEAGVDVYPSDKFKVYAGMVDIDVNATDEEIIEFLLGS